MGSCMGLAKWSKKPRWANRCATYGSTHGHNVNPGLNRHFRQLPLMRTDGQTDTRSYRDMRMHLKMDKDRNSQGIVFYWSFGYIFIDIHVSRRLNQGPGLCPKNYCQVFLSSNSIHFMKKCLVKKEIMRKVEFCCVLVVAQRI